jgi:hypothetical protein
MPVLTRSTTAILQDVERALSLELRSATLIVMTGCNDDHDCIVINLHDPFWRRALEEFRQHLSVAPVG